ncbi:MAG: 16S rRNA (cytidine(1402)-2'-O)-methyltransferase [Dehalococcoidales bacterium]|nr:16S rRNA (cytidine(1402)-2'-O)-methyltransferase [Dehalococcoidales bacterium]
MPILYIVATPIGNMEDITLRALRVLKEVDLIAAEDTRKTKNLLHKYGITKPLTSYYEHNKLSKLDEILHTLETRDVALVSSAGMPGISDPGYELVKAAVKNNVKIVPVPGASAIAAALAVSGLPTDSFLFLGFLPPRQAARRRFLQQYASVTSTMIFLEAPHRLRETLEDILLVFGERNAAVCRELTKIHEEIYRSSLTQALEYFQTPRGEFTLVIGGKSEEASPHVTEDIEKQLQRLKQNGVSARTAIAQLMSQSKLNRKELYQAWLRQNKAE